MNRTQLQFCVLSQDEKLILFEVRRASQSWFASVSLVALFSRELQADAQAASEYQRFLRAVQKVAWAESATRLLKSSKQLGPFLRNAAGSTFFAICLAMVGCRTSSTSSAATVVFNRVPATAQPAHGQEVPDRADTIEGRATGNRPGERIVVYSKTDGRWGLQPPSGQPFTNIGSDGRWQTSTLLGIEYAALLVDPNYNPPEQTESLPGVGAGVAAVATVKGQGPAPIYPSPKTLSFSGYQWTTSTGPIFHAGSRNFFDPANAWVDKNGALHLRISGSPDRWSSAEVKLNGSLGYGTYRFRVEDTTHLEPSAVLTLITWDGVGTERNRRELDVELSRWGFVDNTNVHYVVQPYYVPANFVRFRVPAGVFTHSFRWGPGQVTFSTMTGAGDASRDRPVNEHVFTSGVPSPAGQTVRLALYVFARGQVPLKNENEVVIDKFEYLP